MTKITAKTKFALGFVCAAASVAVFSAACSETPSATGLTPITGITIRTDALFLDVGCGQAPGQAFKYVAMIEQPAGESSNAPFKWALLDCFTDAVFVNLHVGAEPQDYRLHVFVFDESSYTPHAADIGKRSNYVSTGLAPSAKFAVTYHANCTATERQNSLAVAICDPIVAIPIDGGTDAANDAAETDANSDAAAADADGDAEESGTSEGGSDGSSDAPLD